MSPIVRSGGLTLNPAAPGTLFKRPRPARDKKPIRSPRERDVRHLRAIRQLPCLACGQEPCGEAAHVRMGSAAHNKRSCMGAKPDDRWALPLCHDHHMEQHRVGELTFWYRLDISPVKLCVDLYALSPDVEAMRAVVRRAIEARR